MMDYLNNVMGKRKPANKVLKEKSTSGSGHAPDNTDFKQNQTSENNATQDEQRPKEGQTSDIQTESKTRDPPHNIGNPVNQSNRRGLEVFEERRSSVPDLRAPENKQWNNIKHHKSDPVLSQKVVVLKLGDLLYKSVRNNLTLLDELARCLDKEHRHGTKKYWKHLAEHFGVEESTYKTFTCCPQISPTENLFCFLKTRTPTEFTIEKLKEGLNSIDRNDVILDVLKKHQGLDSKLTDKTTLGSLFDGHPLIIGEIAVLLDENETGKKNWRELADWFGVPKRESQNFAESIQDNPTEQLLEYIIACLNPKMTVGYLQSILEDLQMREASDVLTNSREVTTSTLLKDLWDQDYEAADNLCNHLNQRYSTRIRCWRRLGHKLKIKKKDLDTFSPNEDEVISPTEALFNHLGGAKVYLTMEDLIWALDSIDRKDALSVIKDYIPGGVVDKFLELKRAQPTESEV